jgi:CelD/BcsL family acetyltransferase involved in cellulose biosynthesis
VEVRRLQDHEWRADGVVARQWNPLLERSAGNSVYLTWEWVDSWWQTYGVDHESVVFGVFEDDETLYAIAPLMIARRPGLVAHHLRQLCPIGQPSSGEYLDVIVPTGRENELLPVVFGHIREALEREWDVLVIQRMLASSPSVSLAGIAFANDAEVRVLSTGKAPYLALPSSWDEYLGSKSASFRQAYRNSCNRLERAGKVQILVAEQEISFETAFDHLERLHALRFDGGAFSRPGYSAFHRLFARRMLARDGLYLAVLMLDDRPIAARYDFVHGSKIWSHQGGWDPEFAVMRPAAVMTGAVIQWGIERGLREYDFLAGEHGYKERWASGERELVTLSAVNRRTVRGRVYGQGRRRGARSDQK